MQTSYNGISIPANGHRIEYREGNYNVPDRPIIPYIEGDGIGRDIWRASRRVFDAAVEKSYGGNRAVEWYEILAGEKSYRKTQEWHLKTRLELRWTSGFPSRDRSRHRSEVVSAP